MTANKIEAVNPVDGIKKILDGRIWPKDGKLTVEEITEKLAHEICQLFPESRGREEQQAIVEVRQQERERIIKRIEDTAIWHNGILHYNPDAWQALKEEK